METVAQYRWQRQHDDVSDDSESDDDSHPTNSRWGVHFLNDDLASDDDKEPTSDDSLLPAYLFGTRDERDQRAYTRSTKVTKTVKRMKMME